jgi:fatty-acyl-CoA synthase
MSDTSLAPTFGALIVDAIRAHGPRVALIDGERALSYAELGEQIRRALARLAALGLRPGDAVAQLCGNRVEMFCLMAACYVGGYRSVTLHALAGAADHAADRKSVV